MSAYKAESTDSSKVKLQSQISSDKGQNDPVSKYFKGYSSMVFLRRGKHKRKQSRSNLSNLSRELQESEKRTPNIAAKKGEVLGLEEVSNEFTCDSSLVESYHLNTTKEAKFSFRKLEDGTFALETKTTNDPEKSESGLLKRSSKSRHKKGRSSHKPLKICFKKRSKALRKPSDPNEDYKKESVAYSCSVNQDDITCAAANHEEDSIQVPSTGKTWASFKRFVTRRKKLSNSLKRQSQVGSRHLETNANATCVQRGSQNKTFSNLRIPCMNFSRGKRSANMKLTSKDPLCTLNVSENCATESDGERSDEVLAAKYRLQRSLDVKNGKGDLDADVSQENNLDRKALQTCQLDSLNKQCDQEATSSQGKRSDLQQMHGGERDLELTMHLERKWRSSMEGRKPMCVVGINLQSHGVANGPQIKEDMPIEDDNITEVQSDDTNPHNQSGPHELSLVNDISGSVDPNSDIYEFLLMRTAASLVNKVIQSSIQQITTEDALLNHVPCEASERFYI